MYATSALMNTEEKMANLNLKFHRELHGKTFLKTGNALFAAQRKTYFSNRNKNNHKSYTPLDTKGKF